MNNRLTTSHLFALGLMMFALFLGAGNLIFPPAMGQVAGNQVWIATLGFLITGVGLPLLGIIAIALSGGDLQTISSRAHPIFGLIFTVIAYLAIGPFFGIPRTGTVAFEIAIFPFLSEVSRSSVIPLFLFTLFFYSITFFISLNPEKMVTSVGKVITPILLILLFILSVKGIFSPIGQIEEPLGKYTAQPFFNGFLEGYLTMDAIASLVFGIVIIARLKEQGITEKRKLAISTIYAGLIAVTGLSVVYLSLAYLGATSVGTIGVMENGGAILSSISFILLGNVGRVMLGIVITLACLTTSIGLVSATSEYVKKRFEKVSYPLVVATITLFSFIMANLGLAQLLKISLPVLIAIYPIAIVLIILSLFEKYIKGSRYIYSGGVIGASLISIVDGVEAANYPLTSIHGLYEWIPLYTVGVGWVIPSAIGVFIGFIYTNKRRLG